jgi:hypothetical protein
MIQWSIWTARKSTRAPSVEHILQATMTLSPRVSTVAMVSAVYGLLCSRIGVISSYNEILVCSQLDFLISGRAYLFDVCVNVTRGPSEERRLMTGLHTVCDIFCKRCKGMVGWTYLRAYESSQKYKEGKFIIEKINLHLEESDYYEVSHPAGERSDRWRRRSMSWGSESSGPGTLHSSRSDIIFEYDPSSISGMPRTPRNQEASNGATSNLLGGSPSQMRFRGPEGPPAPPFL